MSDKIIIRSYSKAIFLLPTLIFSIFGWIIQAIIHTPVLWIELIWLFLFLCNLFVVCFDFSSGKFIILILIIALISTILYFTALPAILNPKFFEGNFKIQLGLTSHFYIIMTALLSFFMLISFITALFDYYIIERNELMHRKGLFSTVDRWSLTNLRYTKEIPDIFEFLMLRAGTLKFFPTRSDIIVLPTVLNIGRKDDQLNRLLSKLEVDTNND